VLEAINKVTSDQKAWAKLNLYLHVVGRRPDGYHLIDSLFVFLDVGDVVSFGESDEIELVIDGPYSQELGDTKGNLVIAAACKLAKETGTERGAQIRLTKNLPVASGIGGGSADAAATLRGLREHWGLNITDEELMQIGLGLGADIPSCIGSRPAAVSGIGEVVEPIRGLPSWAVVLVNPKETLRTARVFAELKDQDAPFSEADPLKSTPITFERFCKEIAERKNDLQGPAVAVSPMIGNILEVIKSLPDCRLARMSGSGATCFGLFEGIETARVAADELRSRYPDWWISATQPVPGLR